MESIKNTLQETIPKKNFFSHVFDFEKTTQNNLLNLFQYVLIALIPTIILNKCTQRFFPPVDEEKSSLELLAELIGQILFMFFGFVIIHRIITFIPTISKTDYADVNFLSVIIVFLALILSIQSKVSGKTNVLLDRLYNNWSGQQAPLQQQQQNTQHSNQGHPQQGNLLPPPMVQTSSPSFSNGPPPTQGPQPDFNKMYEGPTTPLINAATPSMNPYETFEPMAANEGFSSFGGAGF